MGTGTIGAKEREKVGRKKLIVLRPIQMRGKKEEKEEEEEEEGKKTWTI